MINRLKIKTPVRLVTLLSIFYCLYYLSEHVLRKENSCRCVEHLGFELMNTEFELSLDYLHKMLFTDNELIRKVWTFRKLTKVELSEWKDNKITTSYTIGLGAFGSAKTCETIVEKSINQHQKQV